MRRFCGCQDSDEWRWVSSEPEADPFLDILRYHGYVVVRGIRAKWKKCGTNFLLYFRVFSSDLMVPYQKGYQTMIIRCKVRFNLSLLILYSNSNIANRMDVNLCRHLNIKTMTEK